MGIKLGGMVSGLDTDSIVKALVSSQKYKKTKIESKKQKLEWKKELWGDMNTKIYDFYKSTLSKLRMQSAFKVKEATSSDSSKVDATADVTAAEGTYRVQVKQVATAQYVTSGTVKKAGDENSKVSGSTKLVDIMGEDSYEDGSKISFVNGTKNSSIFVDQNTTVNDFVSAAKQVGLNAVFDTTQQKFFISSTKSGASQQFEIKEEKLNAEQLATVNAWKEKVGYEKLSASSKKGVNEIFDKLLRNQSELDDSVQEKLKGYLKESRKALATTYYTEQLTEKLKSKFIDADGSLTEDGKKAYIASEAAKKNGKSEEDISAMLEGTGATDATRAAAKKAVEDIITSKVKSLMKDDSGIKEAIAAARDSDIPDSVPISTITIGEKTFEGLDGTDYITILSSELSDDSLLQKPLAGDENIITSDTNVDNLYALIQDYLSDVDPEEVAVGSQNSVLKSLGLDNINGTTDDTFNEDGTGMAFVKAKNAEIIFNGALLTSESSSVSVNGIKLNVLDKTESGKELTITVKKDTSAVYDSIKDFISEYNTLLKTMNEAYSAPSAKGYDVLTEEMKEGMSEKEIEKWEAKVKSALLRRDDTLDSVRNIFRSDMIRGVKVSDGKQYSLASIGIMTSSDYTENGILHIKGDEDEGIYADQENTLQRMLDNNPDIVMQIVNGLASNLYNDLTKKMRINSMSSSFTLYNNKTMDKQIKQYEKDIKKWETKLADLEDRYYKQFTSMEKAMANFQSQQNSLSGFFG